MESPVIREAEEISGGKIKASPWPRYEEAVLGFRDYWYPAALSRSVRRKAVALKILGEHLVLVRRGGKCYAIEDRCAHRGVPLSVGTCEFPGTATISCRYHGWTYDLTNGLCVGVVTDGPDSPIVGKVRVKSYPVEERKGLIWVFIGDGNPPPIEQNVPEKFFDEKAVMGVRVNLRKGNWRLAAENGVDPAHAAYLHRNALLSLFLKFPAYRPRIVPEIRGDWVGYTTDPPVMEGDYPGLGRWPQAERKWWKRTRRKRIVVELRLPGLLRVNPSSVPGIDHFEWYVPVDESQHRYFQFLVVWTSRLQAWRFRLAYWSWWRWLLHVNFTGQDARMVRLMEPFYSEEDGWKRERLFRPDAVLTTWRKHCHENAREVQRIVPAQRS